MSPDTPLQDPSASELELLSFYVGDHEYSVDIMSVREISGWTRTTSLPHSPPFVRGVINLRGTVLPVLDLALRLGLEANEPHERNVVVVVDLDGRTLGLRVDAVSDILSIPASAMQQPPEISADSAGSFLRALTIVDERMVRILDLEAVMPSNDEVAA
ncbi:MAG: purine-binding chemotaxis protein CheW [Boseongicola sp.]|nr:purine-binding chemotaxis protein CheW [Boseongicola sp.]